MLKLECDFNWPTGAAGEEFWILHLEGRDLNAPDFDGELQPGRVLLHPSEYDFEVEADLRRGYREMPGREVWCAAPDWDTLVRLE